MLHLHQQLAAATECSVMKTLRGIVRPFCDLLSAHMGNADHSDGDALAKGGSGVG
jgi:hypothetical protein